MNNSNGSRKSIRNMNSRRGRRMSPFGVTVTVMLAVFVLTVLMIGLLLNIGDNVGEETTGTDAPPETSGLIPESSGDETETDTQPPVSSTGDETTTTPDESETTAPETTSAETNPPIDPNQKLVAFSFDDGPNSKYTEDVLAVLEKYNAHATFFVVGVHSSFTRAGEIMRKVVESGHEIGNHTYSHLNLKNLTAAQIREEEEKCSDLIYQLCGVRPTLLRAPGGSYNDDVLAAVSSPLIGWTVDTLDWKHKDPAQALEYLKAQVKDGGIVLMHDRLETSAETAELLLEWLYANGYKVVSVSELMEARGVAMEAGKVYYSDYLVRPNN